MVNLLEVGHFMNYIEKGIVISGQCIELLVDEVYYDLNRNQTCKNMIRVIQKKN